jgi:hypothetical protein
LVPQDGINLAGRSWRLKAGVTVRTRDGSVYQTEATHPLMTQADIEQKFRELVGLRLAPTRVLDLERKLKEVESIANVAELVSDLEIP